jgi:hypothetical protein
MRNSYAASARIECTLTARSRVLEYVQRVTAMIEPSPLTTGKEGNDA